MTFIKKKTNDNIALISIISMAFIGLFTSYYSIASLMMSICGMFWIFFIYQNINKIIEEQTDKNI